MILLSAFSAVESTKNTNTDLQRACMKNKKLNFQL